PANEETHHFFNRERLQQLKQGAILVNTARGSLIDENALYDALESRYISAAGLDVFENEPYQPVNENKDLRTLPNVVLTPHVGSNTDACSKRITERVLQNIRLARDGNYKQMDIVSGS
ncbi:MAG: NAD(P)-dependent oxidoreductase, partial [Balneolaceae bacterium]|nr:NAD(P)-dependent oxidoreductase [Balneolaceae bacterium]